MVDSGQFEELIISTHTPARGVTLHLKAPSALTRISTHTPARGVTIVNICFNGNKAISTHTPARGVTFVPKGSLF